MCLYTFFYSQFSLVLLQILLVKEISANLESYQRMCRTVLTNSEESRYGLVSNFKFQTRLKKKKKQMKAIIKTTEYTICELRE